MEYHSNESLSIVHSSTLRNRLYLFILNVASFTTEKKILACHDFFLQEKKVQVQTKFYFCFLLRIDRGNNVKFSIYTGLKG